MCPIISPVCNSFIIRHCLEQRSQSAIGSWREVGHSIIRLRSRRCHNEGVRETDLLTRESAANLLRYENWRRFEAIIGAGGGLQVICLSAASSCKDGEGEGRISPEHSQEKSHLKEWGENVARAEPMKVFAGRQVKWSGPG